MIEINIHAWSRAVKDVVPDDFFQHAQAVLASHRPDNPALKNFEPLNMAGLTKKEREELQKGGSWGNPEKRYARIDELRGKYSGDQLAREQLDRFDGRSTYYENLILYRQAVQNGDTAQKEKLETWFANNYPLTEANNKR